MTPALFAKYLTPKDIATAAPEELEALIESTGFHHRPWVEPCRSVSTHESHQHRSRVAGFERGDACRRSCVVPRRGELVPLGGIEWVGVGETSPDELPSPELLDIQPA